MDLTTPSNDVATGAVSGTSQACNICGREYLAQLSASPQRSCDACEHVYAWIRDRLTEETQLRVTEISPTSAFADIRLDSLSMIEMIIDLEKQFSVGIFDSAVAELVTVEDAVRCVRVRVMGSLR